MAKKTAEELCEIFVFKRTKELEDTVQGIWHIMKNKIWNKDDSAFRYNAVKLFDILNHTLLEDRIEQQKRDVKLKTTMFNLVNIIGSFFIIGITYYHNPIEITMDTLLPRFLFATGVFTIATICSAFIMQTNSDFFDENAAEYLNKSYEKRKKEFVEWSYNRIKKEISMSQPMAKVA